MADLSLAVAAPTPLVADDLRALVERDHPAAVTIACPVHSGPGADRAARVLRRLLDQAEVEFGRAGVEAPAERLAALRPLVEDVAWWRDKGPGLAFFFGGDLQRAHLLPVAIAESVTVMEGFRVRPLLPLIAGDGLFAALALDQHGARLWRATRHRFDPLAMPGAPSGIDDVPWVDSHERQLSTHATGSGAGAGFYADSGYDFDHMALVRVREFFRSVDAAAWHALGPNPPPLVLCGVPHLIGLYRQVARHVHPIDEHVPHHPVSLPDDELRRQAWRCVEGRFAAPLRAAAERVLALLPRGLATADLGEALRAAETGRIQELFVPASGERWGRWSDGRMQLHPRALPGDSDLYDLLARQALRTGAEVFVAVAGMPGGGEVAASLRW